VREVRALTAGLLSHFKQAGLVPEVGIDVAKSFSDCRD
jgi:hypothetical protein